MSDTSSGFRHWGIVQPLPAPVIAQIAQQAESQGVVGLFAPQVYGPPFIPLAVAAGATEKLLLASGIAIAAARSPFETAMAAIDMDRISSGRFVLGLCPSRTRYPAGAGLRQARLSASPERYGPRSSPRRSS